MGVLGRLRAKLRVCARPWRAPKARDRTHGYLDSFVRCLVFGRHGYLDCVAFVTGTPGYLDNGIELGRAGLFFAGATIGFIACGFGSPTHGYLDWSGCVAFGELRGVGREVAVRLSMNARTRLAPEAVS